MGNIFSVRLNITRLFFLSFRLEDQILLSRIFSPGKQLIDLRSPEERIAGELSCAINLPIFLDKEMDPGKAALVDKGLPVNKKLVIDYLSSSRGIWMMTEWARQLDSEIEYLVFCQNGGLRSEIALDILKKNGFSADKVPGGYEYVRSNFIDLFHQPEGIFVVSGLSGAVKRSLLIDFEHYIDVSWLMCEPVRPGRDLKWIEKKEKNFENEVAIQRFHKRALARHILKDEPIFLSEPIVPKVPKALVLKSSVIFLETSLEERVENIIQERITDQLSEYQSAFGDILGFHYFTHYLLDSVRYIEPELGSSFSYDLRKLISRAVYSSDPSAHEAWVRPLLTDYYDPLQSERLVGVTEIFRGNASEVIVWLESNLGRQVLGTR